MREGPESIAFALGLNDVTSVCQTIETVSAERADSHGISNDHLNLMGELVLVVRLGGNGTDVALDVRSDRCLPKLQGTAKT